MTKKYKLELTIYEGNDEFWEGIKNTGCDEVAALIVNALAEYGFYIDDNYELKLLSFTDEVDK